MADTKDVIVDVPPLEETEALPHPDEETEAMLKRLTKLWTMH